MSSIYISEPPTNGKILLNTTVGEIELELWSKEAPFACRNFVQLCLEGYYDDTIFHRLVAGFIVQGGDPTGTGEGGESVYDKPFKTEIHSRLRFNRRGLVAMAIQEANSNRSQFFFTLDAAPELDKKHTLFAKIVGQTIYNMIKLSESPVDRNERPLNPHKILTTEVIVNPFPDIIPRKSEKPQNDDGKKKSSRSKGSKNFSLLSFGEEAEEDEQETDHVAQQFRGKGKSSHDLLNDPRMSSVPVSIEPVANSDSDHDSEKADSEEKQRLISGIRDKLSGRSANSKAAANTHNEEDVEPLSKIEALRKEAEQLKRQIVQSKRRPISSKSADDSLSNGAHKDADKSTTGNDLLNAFHASQNKYRELCSKTTTVGVPAGVDSLGLKAKKGSGGGSREEQTLALFNKFKSRLHSAVADGGAEEKSALDDVEEGEEEEVVGSGWLTHKLQFVEPTEKRVIDANRYDPDRYDIADPRNPINIRKRKSSSRKKGDADNTSSSKSRR